MDKKPQKRRIILGGLLAGLLLIGIAIFLIVVFSPKPKKDTARALNQHRTSESSLMSASSTQASKSDPLSTALTEWKSLALNQQIALLAQSYAQLNPQTTILSSDHMAMTGNIEEGAIEWYDSNKIIHKVNVKINQATVKYNYINAETWETEEQTTKINTVLADYFETPIAKQATEKIASRVIDSAQLTSLNSEMNLEQIAQGDYSSVQGTWKTLNGSILIFENNQCYIVEDGRKTKLVLTPLTADNLQNQGFLMVNSNPEGSPAGAGLSFIPTGYDWADTDKAKPRLWLSNTFDPSAQSLPERQKLAVQQAIFYKVD
ncbi:DUF6287 domain-containing protein [Lactococcus garvieae]|uniref:DUF6287 domain-containing protein n=1 Tax=Lactococcus garvieae TaxID=1363 RepID=UPI0038526755